MTIANLFESLKFESYSEGDRFKGATAFLGKEFGAKNLGFGVDVLQPKTFSSPYHYHEQEEELAIVLEGRAILRMNGKFREVKAGDLIYYGTGPESAHHFYNHSDEPFKFFVLSSKFPSERVYYPDTRKTLDRGTRKVIQDGLEVDYMKDEMDPSIYWPSEALEGKIENL